ncbi:hypothetical protein BD626DRAFT_636149 [Schizophyllum amplum]|uniref:Uncharacterized protein n=1 Tax=Schizophyllum amplum TaxID=97359 RepID=A0A550BTT3_9AGAR|nr:hypothetical protein BD626DRAFT_636149 [Auriculariopsis ampla]
MSSKWRRSRQPIASEHSEHSESSRWVIITDDNTTAALPWTSSTVSSASFSTASSTQASEPLFSALCTTTDRRPYGVTLNFYLFPYDRNASSVDTELDRVDHICGRHRHEIRGVKIKISTSRPAPWETDPLRLLCQKLQHLKRCRTLVYELTVPVQRVFIPGGLDLRFFGLLQIPGDPHGPKRIELMMEAFPRLCEVHVCSLGDPQQWRNIRPRSTVLKIHVANQVAVTADQLMEIFLKRAVELGIARITTSSTYQ